jgi:hypothetical protein
LRITQFRYKISYAQFVLQIAHNWPGFRIWISRLERAQGIEAEILLAQPKDWSGKPGLRRFTPQMRPNSEL